LTTIDAEIDADRLRRGFEEAGYVTEPALGVAVAMAEQLQRPLLLEGEAGVGKTEVAQAWARATGRKLIRLQCYEGLDVSTAVYEWNYQRQLLAIKAREQGNPDPEALESDLFSEDYLLRRPLLEAISAEQPSVLLIDELDRADEEFEAYLLEVLSEYQVSIPEVGTVTAQSVPGVVLTSNASRDLSDALRRRCLYYYLDYPDFDKELAIVQRRLPGIDERLARQIIAFVQGLRREELHKRPGIAETLDWAAALMGLGVDELDSEDERLPETLICLLKTRQDQAAIRRGTVARLISDAT